MLRGLRGALASGGEPSASNPSGGLPEGAVWLGHGALRFGPFELKQHPRTARAMLVACDGRGNLRVGEHGVLAPNGGMGKWAQFNAATTTAGAWQFRSFGNETKGWCLGVESGDLVGTAAEPATFVLLPVANGEANAPPALSAFPDFVESVDLTEQQRLAFKLDGYVHLPGCVPSDLVEEAVASINASLCTPGAVTKDGDGMGFCPGLGATKAIQNLLYKSPAWTYAQRLLGRGKVSKSHGAQIALRAPMPKARANGGVGPSALPPTQWHIDGMGKGKHSPFSVLMGIALSPVPVPNSGNFCVFPGSHTELLPLLRAQVEAGSALFSNEGDQSKPQFHNGVQVLAMPGDVVIAHQKLAHRGGPNASSAIRYQVYFRLSHKDHASLRDSGVLLDDLWVEFEGLR